MKSKIKVAILLTTCNSEKFIQEQIDSILKQKNIKPEFYISDDCSSDQTLNIIKLYFKKYPTKFKKLYKVQFKNSCKNFYNLILKVPKEYNYYAMSDHDDVWLNDKLIRAVNILKKGYDLYGSRVTAVDTNLNFIGYSPLFKKKPIFKNAIVQGLFANCTTVFTKDIIHLIKLKKINFETDPSWLIYLITTFNNKKVYYDSVSKILYRQHPSNIWGIGFSLKSKIFRLTQLLLGNNKRLNDKHVNFLKKISSNRLNKNIEVLEKFDYMRNNLNFFKYNNAQFNKLGIYRQTSRGNFLLKIGIILGRE